MSILEDLLATGMKPEPASEEELEAVASLRLGDYEILSEKLVLIAQEGKEVMTRMGISSMLHSGDTLVAVYTAAGDLVAPVCGTYLHSVTGQIPIKFTRATSSTATKPCTAASTTRISSLSCRCSTRAC